MEVAGDAIWTLNPGKKGYYANDFSRETTNIQN